MTANSEPVDINKKLEKLSLKDGAEEVSTSFGSCKLKDVELFIQASELERAGKIGQAIKLYEQAFRLNPDVDRDFNNSHELFYTKSAAEPAEVTSDMIVIRQKVKFQAVVPGLLQEIKESIEDDYDPLGLPAELLQRILSWTGSFHAVSLEEAARTCKQMYVASRSPTIWRRMCHLAYATSLTCFPSVTPLPALMSYRDQYFSRPRLRTDGLYICKISYFRPGLTDGVFYQPVHLVTYYRYLRFLGAEYNYTAMLMVTTEEPARVLDLLRNPPDPVLADFVSFGVTANDLVPSFGGKRMAPTVKNNHFRKANLFIGKYYRDDPSSSRYLLTLYNPHSHHNSLFEMELSIVGKRNNVIHCDRYSSLSSPVTATARISRYDFDIKEWGNFIFSRVRSFVS